MEQSVAVELWHASTASKADSLMTSSWDGHLAVLELDAPDPHLKVYELVIGNAGRPPLLGLLEPASPDKVGTWVCHDALCWRSSGQLQSKPSRSAVLLGSENA
jgi:hypothetical protein